MEHQAHQAHQEQAQAAVTRIRCGIITVSDTRTTDTDTSGALIREALTQAGHDVVRYALVKDEPEHITNLVRAAEADGCQVIITNGGTGIARRDSTFEAIDALLTKRLPGFGELFRLLSYHEIGPAAMLSRATAGVYGRSLIFSLPGSTGAVRLALTSLIVPELPHLIWETLRQ
jgi:molybdenum cofactor biosynthesis protein B